MIKTNWLYSLFAIFLCGLFPTGLHAQHQENVDLDTMYEYADPPLTHYPLIEDLRLPWGMVYGPDNYLWVTERNGRISRIDPQTGDQIVLLVMNNVKWVDPFSEEYKKYWNNSGLMGIALDPAFPKKPYVYVVYTTVVHDSFCSNRLSRFTYKPDTLIDEKILLDSVWGYSEHDGGRLMFDPSGKLLMSTGDHADGAIHTTSLAQDMKSLNGKILRINTDGSIPKDNPSPKSYIWASELRDPQGLALGRNGTIYNSDHGPDFDDEINIITKGGNYGWNNVQGIADSIAEIQYRAIHHTIDPIWYWSPTNAPRGIAYCDTGCLRFSNSLFVAMLKGTRLIQLKLDKTGTRVVRSQTLLKNEYERLRSVCVAPDEKMYITTSNTDGKVNAKSGTDMIIVLYPSL